MKRGIKILMIDVFPDHFRRSIETLGVELRYETGQDRTFYKNILPEYEVLILNSAVKVDEDLMQNAHSLKLVLRAGVGTDHIDEEALKKRGIQLISTPGANAQAVGEMALGHLLVLLRNLRRADQQVRQFIWKREPNRGIELSSLTVGIIGYGHTGQAFAKMAAASGCRILAYDKYKSNYSDAYVKESTVETIQKHADVLSFHIPLTNETRHWGCQSFFEAFDKSIYLLNLSRGEIILTKDLPDLLNSGKILGAGLDVLEQENMAKITDEMKDLYLNLMQRENILFSPHIGGWTYTSADNIYNRLLQALKEFYSI